MLEFFEEINRKLKNFDLDNDLLDELLEEYIEKIKEYSE